MISISLSALSQSWSGTIWFKTTDFSFRYKVYGEWTDWSEWEESNMKVKFNTDDDVIVIYSKETQIYKVLSLEDSPYDSSGTQVKFRVIDQDSDYGYIRLRVTDNGYSQLYVDFSDISWVYNVKRIN